MEVKGRGGGMPGQKLTFGDYFSGKVERRVAVTDEDAYAISSQTTRDTMLFEVFDTTGNSSKVFCLSKSSELNLPVTSEKYPVTVGSQDVCIGRIVLDANSPSWNFTIENPNAIATDVFSEGVISNNQTSIIIKDIHHNSRGKLMKDQMLGFEFWEGDKVIGAVELMGGGRILIKNSLPQDLKFLIATTSATMLLRYDMSKAERRE